MRFATVVLLAISFATIAVALGAATRRSATRPLSVGDVEGAQRAAVEARHRTSQHEVNITRLRGKQ